MAKARALVEGVQKVAGLLGDAFPDGIKYARELWDDINVEEAYKHLTDQRYGKGRVGELERMQNLVTRKDKTGNFSGTPISIEDLEGQGYITSMADRSDAGGILTHIKGVELETPVSLLGGQGFMFNNKEAWAQAKGAGSGIKNVGEMLRKQTGQSPILIPNRMAPTGGDFAGMNGEAMLSFAQTNMTQSQKTALNKEMKKFAPNWKSIDSKDFIDDFQALSKANRDKVMNMMDTKFRNDGGLSIGEGRLATSEARQVQAPDTRIQNIASLDLDAPMGLVNHPAYTHGMAGQGLGTIKEDLPAYALKPQSVNEMKAGYNRPVSDVFNPTPEDVRSLQMGAKGGIITEDLLRHLDDLGVLGSTAKSSPVALAGAGGLLAMTASDDSDAGVGTIVKSLIKAGYPESTAVKIASGELPMDKASRMARAGEQGFTEKAFHSGADQNAFRHEDILGEEVGGGGIINIQPRSDEQGVAGLFASGKTPQVSQSYTRGIGRSPASYPLLVNPKGMEMTDAKRNNWGSIWEPEVYGNDGRLVTNEYDDPIYQGKLVSTDMLARQANERGATGAIINNVQDVGPNPMSMSHSIRSTGADTRDYLDQYAKTGGQVYAINDGSKARSALGAAFDPDQINSTNILASNPVATGAAGILGLLGLTPDDAQAMPLEQLFSPENMSMLSKIASQADIDGTTIEAIPQTYSSQVANSMADQMDGNQASRNRRAQSLGGILDFSPVGGADAMREGKQLREEGNTLEGLLYSILGAAEFVPVAGQAIGKAGRAGLGLLR